MDLRTPRWSGRWNSTKVFRSVQRIVQGLLLFVCVPLLLVLLAWDMSGNPNPVPSIVVIAGIVMLCFFFS